MAHLEDLHSLLRSTYFSSWPLRVRFFCADVYRVWRAWNDRVDSRLPDNVKVIIDGDNLTTPPDSKQGDELAPVGSINNLSVDYTRLERVDLSGRTTNNSVSTSELPRHESYIMSIYHIP